jgi:hypothetical protein
MFEPSVNEGIGAVKGSRPKLKIPFTQIEIYCEIISAVALTGMAIYLMAMWTKLPAQIPGHFNIRGQPDRWDSRNSIFILFGVMVALYAGLSILQRFPHIYNYPFGLTPRNVHRQYQLARELITLIKVEIVLIFVFIHLGIMNVARGQCLTLGPWLMPVIILPILITIIQYCIRAAEAR